MFTGIIQAIGKVREPEKLGNGVRLTISAPDLGLDQVGIGESIAVNGVSLTINEVEDTSVGPRFSINLIPHTMEVTTLHFLKAQSLVNLEVDLIARYVQRNMELREGDDIL